MHNFCSCYIDKYNSIYVHVHRNILMYNNILYLHTIYYVDMHINTILAVCLVFMKCTPPPLHMRKILLVLNDVHLCYVEVLTFVHQTTL